MATLQHPRSFVAAQHKSGHSRVNRCGLVGLASHDTFQMNFLKKAATCILAVCCVITAENELRTNTSSIVEQPELYMSLKADRAKHERSFLPVSKNVTVCGLFFSPLAVICAS